MGIKELFTDIKDKVSDTADKTINIIDNKIDIAKLKKSIQELKAELDSFYADLGKFVIESDDQDEIDLKIASTKEKAEELNKKIATLEEERLAKSGKFLCCACKKEIDVGVAFCPHCGEKTDH